MITFSYSDRGKLTGDFEDSLSQECRLQVSTDPFREAIWLGVLHEEMQLTREQVKTLLPYLEAFANRGEMGLELKAPASYGRP